MAYVDECRCYIFLSKDLGYISLEDYEALTTCINDASRLLNTFAKGIEKHDFSNEL